ncbi:MAG: hypothetical protein JW943_14675 [Deltaproteobacteria bacterium]|nr:hypothetical protein [Deltaproteobacteria bacterium]
MKTVTINRIETSAHGTFGVLHAEGLTCFTCEPPWKGNQPALSCIPEGGYLCVPWHSQRFPNHYCVTNVPDRTAILIHTGNLAGDKSKGFRRHSLGCILPGIYRGFLGHQKAVFSSWAAFNKIREIIGENSFRLDINWECDHGIVA